MANVRAAAYDQAKQELAAHWHPHPVPDGERIGLDVKRDKARAQVADCGTAAGAAIDEWVHATKLAAFSHLPRVTAAERT